MSPHITKSGFPPSLPPINVANSRKDVKAPRYPNDELSWLYGLWLAKGGLSSTAIHFSVPKKSPEVSDKVSEIGFFQFNVQVRLADHSTGKYRLYMDSKPIRNWWEESQDCHPCPSSATGQGIIDGGSWVKAGHLIVTCKRGKVEQLSPHLKAVWPDLDLHYRNGKNSCDIYLVNFLDRDR